MAETTTVAPAPVRETRDINPEADPSALLSLFRATAEKESAEPEATPAPEAPPPETASAPSGDEVPTEDVPAGDEEAVTEETPTEPTLYTVPVDGGEEQVTLEELKRGYSRTGDYTRKTMALADDRRAMDAAVRDARAERERYVAGLKDVEGLLTQSVEEPDWPKLAEELEPVAYNKARAQWDMRQRRLNDLRVKREDLERQAQQEQAVEKHQQIRAEQQRLYAAIPEWKDTAKAQTEQRDIVDYVLTAGEPFGVTADALNAIDTAFPMFVLRKAMLYDRMMAAKPKVVAQKVPTPTAKPGAKPTPVKVNPKDTAFAKLAETGDPQAFEEYILQRLTAPTAGR